MRAFPTLRALNSDAFQVIQLLLQTRFLPRCTVPASRIPWETFVKSHVAAILGVQDLQPDCVPIRYLGTRISKTSPKIRAWDAEDDEEDSFANWVALSPSSSVDEDVM